ncbi:hypothetical protein [Pseudomonas sp. LRF_L74]|uniref:hypothetical protein n=1 Tax=Pseudomonas sp. LRF_L74 TaxID=3369422 RepID=UPI003F6282A1
MTSIDDFLDGKSASSASGMASSGMSQIDDFLGPEEPQESSSIIRRAVGDTGLSLLKGAIAIPETVVGLADIPTGGRVGKSLEELGFRPREAREMLDDFYSPEQKAANARVQEADGFVDTASAMLSNPSTIIHTGVEAAPSMLAGGIAGRTIRALPAIGQKIAPWAAGAIGEGIVSAGMSAENIRQQTDDGLLTPEQSALAATSGAATGVIGAGGARLAQRFGVGELDTLLAGGTTRASGKSLPRRVAEGALIEGGLQELPQSAQEQALQNIALDRPTWDGVGSAAAAGLITGGVMGGVVGPLGHRQSAAPAAPPTDQQAPAGPIARAATMAPRRVNDTQRATLLNDLPGDQQASSGYRPADLETAVAQQLFHTEVDDQQTGTLKFYRRDPDLQRMVEVSERDALNAARSYIEQSRLTGDDPSVPRDLNRLLPVVEQESGPGQTESITPAAAFNPGEQVTWANADFDQPVQFLGFEPEPGADGRLYASVRLAGRDGYVPADELRPRQPEQPPLAQVDFDSGPQSVDQVRMAPLSANELLPTVRARATANEPLDAQVIARELGVTHAAAEQAVRGVQAEQQAVSRSFPGKPGANAALRGLLNPEAFEVVRAGQGDWRIQQRASSTDAIDRFLDGESSPEQQSNGQYSRASYRQPSPGSTRADALRTQVAELTSGWKNAPPVEVVQSVGQLPADLQQQVQRDRAFDLEGAYSGNTVYLVADNLSNQKHAAFVLQHEVLGHAGLQGAYGSRLRLKMLEIYNDQPGIKAQADQLMERFGYSREVAVEEVLADLAADGTIRQQAFWPRLATAIRNALRAIGLRMTWSDTDIQAMLANSRRYITGQRQGTSQPGTDAARYRRVDQRIGDALNRITGPRPLDPNDPFAAENRRLREDDKTIWAKAKQQLRRQFAPGGLLPEAVFSEKIRRDSEFQAVEFDVRHIAGGLEQAVKADFGKSIDKLSAEQMTTLADALAGKVDPSLPEATRTAVVTMRQYIDSLSGEYIGILQQQVRDKLDGADPALIDKITGNLGSYVHRSYRAFDDPTWYRNVQTETVNAARRYLAASYQEQGSDVTEANRLADVVINEMLKTGTAYDSMDAFIAEGKLGAKDLSVLIKRKEIAPQIRALLGEYTDPRLNFAKSATKMGRLIWNQRFLDRVRDVGLGTFLFEGKNRPAAATSQIVGEQSDSYSPLNGLWTFPEVAQSFKDALGKEQMSDLYRTIVRLNGMVKYGKTILSPTTAMRNWQSAMFFSLANGHFDLTQMKKSWAAFREQVTQNAKGDDLAYLRKLKQLGVVYDTPYAGEMMDLLRDARMDELLSSKTGTGIKYLRKMNQVAQGFYSFGDDFWKIIGFENEKAGLIKAGIPSAQAELMAAERIRNTYPTYSMVGRGINWLRRFPLAGSFVSFPAEIIRTSANMLRLTASDLKSNNPAIRTLGMKRAAGMALVSAGFYALAAMSKAAFGVGDDEEEAVRDLSPPWQRNSTFLFTGRDADGKLRYFDMSFLDPYGYWKRPITAMLRDQPWQQAATSSIGDMLSPFLGTDIAAGAIFEVMSNKKGSGGQVYLENGDPVDQTLDIANHLRKALQPGFVSNAERLLLAGKGARREGSGQPYDMRDELVSLLGWRASTLDTQTALFYRSFEFTDALGDARKTLMRTVRSANQVSDSDIRSSRQAAEQQYEKAFKEMGRLVASAKSAGMGAPQIVRTLRLSGISQANVMALMANRVPPLMIGTQTQASAMKQAAAMQGRDQAVEVARRFAVARAASN